MGEFGIVESGLRGSATRLDDPGLQVGSRLFSMPRNPLQPQHERVPVDQRDDFRRDERVNEQEPKERAVAQWPPNARGSRHERRFGSPVIIDGKADGVAGCLQLEIKFHLEIRERRDVKMFWNSQPKPVSAARGVRRDNESLHLAKRVADFRDGAQGVAGRIGAEVKRDGIEHIPGNPWKREQGNPAIVGNRVPVSTHQPHTARFEVAALVETVIRIP